MSSKLLPLAGILSALLLVGCTPAVEEAADETTEAVETTAAEVVDSAETAADDMAESADDMMEADYEMTMENFSYSVEEITAAPGDTFTIKVENVGGFHDIDIDELNIDTEPVEEGESIMITVEIPEDAESGTEYAYYCSVGQHRAQGMEGMIVVE